jgi:hypothetical protein
LRAEYIPLVLVFRLFFFSAHREKSSINSGAEQTAATLSRRTIEATAAPNNETRIQSEITVRNWNIIGRKIGEKKRVTERKGRNVEEVENGHIQRRATTEYMKWCTVL